MNKKPLKDLFEAMYHGKYSFEDFIGCDISAEYSAFTIQERNKSRLIYKTTKKLKTFHSFLSLFIFEHLKINPRVVFSYRKGFNAFDAVSKHSESKFFFQTDIANFFPSLTTPIVRNTILSSIELSPATDALNYFNRIVELVTIDGCLPQGFSTSPILSNACLTDFDNKLESYCLAHNLIYTRYSDDIIISSQDNQSLSDADNIVRKFLHETFENQLLLNPLKSKLTRKGSKVKLLGLVILPTGKVTVDLKIKNRIETLLHYYKTDISKFLELDGVERDMAIGTDLIFGLLNYVNTVDKSYLEKLRKKFGVTTIDMFFRRPAK